MNEWTAPMSLKTDDSSSKKHNIREALESYIHHCFDCVQITYWTVIDFQHGGKINLRIKNLVAWEHSVYFILYTFFINELYRLYMRYRTIYSIIYFH